jgi:WD40 repeat protein
MRVQAIFTGHRGPVYALAEGAEPGTFLSGSGDGLVVQWQVDRPDEGAVLVNVGQAVFSLCLLQQAGLLLIGTEGGRLHVVDLDTRREVRLFEVHQRGIFRMVPLPHQRVACAGGDGSLSIWQWGPGKRLELLRQFPVVEEKLRDLCTSPRGDLLAVAAGDGSVRLLDSDLFNELHTVQAHPPVVTFDTAPGIIGTTALAWHPGKPVLLSGGKDGHLRLWRSDAGFAELLALPAHKAGIYCAAFDPDGRRLATASRDKSAKLWDAATMAPLARLDRAAGGHTHSVDRLLWMGTTLLTASDDRRIIAWADEGMEPTY